jgi:uncharacterized protein (TIGR02145 family)
MKNLRFISFCILLTLSIFNSYAQNNNSKKETTDPAYHDEGVVINGVKWATRNVDKPGTFAAKPEDAGMFYQWNRKIGWSSTDPIINSDGGTNWDNSIPTGTTWEKANDPSPEGWRVPTLDEIKTLFDSDKVNLEWTTENGVNGRKFTDKISGNSLFLLAAGSRSNSDGMLYETGFGGYYWSSTASGDSYAYYLFFSSNDTLRISFYRGIGFNIRAVTE